MGRAVNLSPLGLFNWDSHVFDLMVIPEQLDRDVLINNLLAETAELEVLYPNPVVFKNLLGVWSSKQLDIWNRLYATTQYEYNPIENYNRYEEGSQSGSSTNTHSGTDTETIRHSGTDSNTVTQSGRDTYSDDMEKGGSDTTEGSKTSGHWIAGFDSTASGDDDGLVKQTRDEEEAESTTNYGATESKDGEINYGKSETGTTTYGKTVTDATAYGHVITGENDGEHELHAHGNIGVTTTQKLIREQREVDLFNLYDIIIEDFKMRFCIMVY